MAKELELKLKEGDVAPDFSVATNGGGKISLAELRGQNVVLYFYPKDDTPGCTKEACAFRDNLPKFKSGKAAVLGISILDEASKARVADDLSDRCQRQGGAPVGQGEGRRPRRGSARGRERAVITGERVLRVYFGMFFVSSV